MSKTAGEKLRELRGDRSQDKVARDIGISQMSVSYYERGKREPSDEVKAMLASYYKTTVQSIFS